MHATWQLLTSISFKIKTERWSINIHTVFSEQTIGHITNDTVYLAIDRQNWNKQLQSTCFKQTDGQHSVQFSTCNPIEFDDKTCEKNKRKLRMVKGVRKHEKWWKREKTRKEREEDGLKRQKKERRTVLESFRSPANTMQYINIVNGVDKRRWH